MGDSHRFRGRVDRLFKGASNERRHASLEQRRVEDLREVRGKQTVFLEREDRPDPCADTVRTDE